MANSVINTAVGGLLQAYANNVAGTNVQAEAVVLVDNTGNFIGTLPVSVAANLNINGTVTANATITSNVNVNGTAVITSNVNINGTVVANAGTGTFLTNLGQVNGTTADTNIGNATAGTLRVVLASNQPNVNVAGSLSISPNSAFNLSQVGGGTTSTAGQTGTLAVGGAVTNGIATSSASNPLLVAGSDYQAAPKVQLAKVDSGGGMYVNVLGAATVAQSNASNLLATVSGTVTAIQSNASNLAVSIPGTITAVQSNASNLAVSIPNIVQINELPDGTSTTAPLNATSTAYQASLVVKASSGVLFSMSGHNSRTTPQFIQFHNATSLPNDGVAPVIVFIVPASTSFSFDFGGKFGRYFSTGIVVCNSSTGPAKTLGATDCWFDVQYK